MSEIKDLSQMYLADMMRIQSACRLTLVNPFEEMLRQMRPTLDEMRRRLDLGQQMLDVLHTYRHDFTELMGVDAHMSDLQRFCGRSPASL